MSLLVSFLLVTLSVHVALSESEAPVERDGNVDCVDHLPLCVEGICKTNTLKTEFFNKFDEDGQVHSFEIKEDYKLPLKQLCRKTCGLCKPSSQN